jgi:TRAP-type C4-dicarboxylate transport system permease small subunit
MAGPHDSPARHALRRFYAGLIRVEALLAGLFLILMVALIFAGGIARMLQAPQNWTIDLASCLFAWACFLCADIAWRNDALMSITLVTERVPRAVQRVLLYLNYTIIAGFLGYLIYAGTWLAWVSRARSFQGIPGVSYSWVTSSLAVGGVLLMITTVLKVRRALQADGVLKPRPAQEGS